jgi:hypothetical protein
MVKAQADDEEDQHTDDLSAWVKVVYPGSFVKVEEDVHSKPINAKMRDLMSNVKAQISNEVQMTKPKVYNYLTF